MSHRILTRLLPKGWKPLPGYAFAPRGEEFTPTFSMSLFNRHYNGNAAGTKKEFNTASAEKMAAQYHYHRKKNPLPKGDPRIREDSEV